MTKCRTEHALFSSEHVIHIRESTSCVRVCDSRAYPVFNQSSGGSFPSYAISIVFARWDFLLHAAEKNNNAAKFCVSLKQNNSEGFISAPSIFFSFKETKYKSVR